MINYQSICELYESSVFPIYFNLYCLASAGQSCPEEALPMTEKIVTLEPTFADAMTAIANAADLTEENRRHWRSSLAGIAKAFDQPLELIPARYSAIRARMATLHHVPLDW